MRSLVVVGLLAAPSLAAADDVAAPSTETPTAPPLEASPFVTMFHQDVGTKVDIDVAYMFVNSDDPNNPTKLYRGDLFAQYVDPSSGFGGYATVPFTHATDAMITNDSVGGLEVGGVLVRKLDTATMVVHAGIVLPTASSDDSAVVGIGSVMRLPEIYATIPDAVSFRIGISPLFHAGPIIVRLDVNLDVNLSAKGNETQKPGLELDAGMGYSSGLVAIMAELTNVIITGDSDNLTFDVGAISARFDLGKVKPYIAVSFPLDDGARQSMKAGLTVGLSATP